MHPIAAHVDARGDAELPDALAHRFEAVVLDWDGAAPAAKSNLGALRPTIEALSLLGMDLYLVTEDEAADVDGRLGARPRGPGHVYVCAGAPSQLCRAGEQGIEPVAVDPSGMPMGPADPSSPLRSVFADLWSRGVSARLALVLGDEHGADGLSGDTSLLAAARAAGAVAFALPGERAAAGGIQGTEGLDLFSAVLTDQLARRERRDVPELAGDDGWTLEVDGVDPELERVHETLLVVGDGRIASNGAPAWADASSDPRVLAAGVYDGEGPETELLRAPVWHVLAAELPSRSRLERVLDLRTGILGQKLSSGDGDAAAVSFSSLARPGTVALRVAAPAPLARGGRSLAPADLARTETGSADRATFVRAAASKGGIAAAARDVESPSGLERLGAYVSDPEAVPDPEAAVAALADSAGVGYEALLREHRAAWAGRWEDADVVIPGDEELQLAVRFALFHLMASVASEGEAAVGARGLTGPGYRGHVFWDTDVFVLPFLAATHPPAARAILEYRIRRLPVALRAARELGLAGARFAWESAREGFDVTPPSARDATGRVVRIRTGESEEHVVADVAWAASTYVDWTGDDEFASGPGLPLLVETARYWASRVRYGGDGRAHQYGVIGPDEYHEPVDDNAFTNVLARWNLRRAASLPGVDPGERSRWLQ
ncbi:MAG: glycoside hydrolase family 65 protein, partial [Thermoleophilia bacterium]|nr:glycoside hydrolase family 65 protein [Thermoleophilia bacterium]